MSEPRDPLLRLFGELRSRLEATRAGQPLASDAVMATLLRLERATSLLRRASLTSIGEFEHRIQDLSLVRQMGELFASILDLDRLCEALLAIVGEAIPCGTALLYLVEPGRDVLELRAAIGQPLDEGDRGVADRVALFATETADPIWIADVATHPQLESLAPSRNLGSLLACPLVMLGETIGVIEVGEPSPRGLAAEQARILRPVAELAVVAVRHARVCNENLANARNLERLVEDRTREVNEARAALSRQERVAAMGKLAASIAHEVNNPMSFVISNLERGTEYTHELEASLPVLVELFESAASLPMSRDPHVERTRAIAKRAGTIEATERLTTIVADFGELLQEAREGADRIQRVGDGLRAFAQGVAGEMEPADLNRLAETALHIVRADAKDHIRFECEFGVLPHVRCDRYRMTHVLLNLLQNAVEAIEAEGLVRVTTCCVGRWVELQIADDGAGIGADQLDRIFEPFFTTKLSGSGLGLSISRDIVSAHRGTLAATSGPEGTVFTLRLPVAEPIRVASQPL